MASFEPKPFGKYFLTEKIAIGGMAEIYKAKTFGVDGFEKLLAIKKILPHYSADKEFIAMLTDEAKLVVRLSHTNIVQIYDLGKVGDDYYISMEFIDGVNLREVLNRAKDLKDKPALPICIFIASEVCKGLDYAHSKRDDQGESLHIVHRDISPQNVLISFEGETKIVDFGIAKAALNVSHTSAGILKGKITYMSPEQALGKPVDGRTDLFSVGILLYEMISGERLFAGDTQFEILQKIRSTQITEESLKNIPAEIRPVLAKALAYYPKDRFASAGDFQIALTKILYSRYSDFSPKNLATLIKKWFSAELKIRKKKAQEEASISSATKNSLENSSKQQSLVVDISKKDAAPGLDDNINPEHFLADTTKPEDGLRPDMFVDTTKPENRLKPDMLKHEPSYKEIGETKKESESIELPPKKSRVLFLFVLLIVVLLGTGIYFLYNKVNTSIETPLPDNTIDTTVIKPPFEDPIPEKDGMILPPPAGIKTPLEAVPVPINPPVETMAPEVKMVEQKPVEVPKIEEPKKVEEQSKALEQKKIEDQKRAEEQKKKADQKKLSEKNQESKKSEPKKEIVPPPIRQQPPPPRTPEATESMGGTGEIRVDSSPRGASVTVDGQKSGVTPIVARNLKRGSSHSITVSLPGYGRWSRSVTLTQGHMEISAPLQKE